MGQISLRVDLTADFQKLDEKWPKLSVPVVCALCLLWSLGKFANLWRVQWRVGLCSPVLQATAIPISYTRGVPPYLLAYVEHTS